IWPLPFIIAYLCFLKKWAGKCKDSVSLHQCEGILVADYPVALFSANFQPVSLHFQRGVARCEERRSARGKDGSDQRPDSARTSVRAWRTAQKPGGLGN